MCIAVFLYWCGSSLPFPCLSLLAAVTGGALIPFFLKFPNLILPYIKINCKHKDNKQPPGFASIKFPFCLLALNTFSIVYVCALYLKFKTPFQLTALPPA